MYTSHDDEAPADTRHARHRRDEGGLPTGSVDEAMDEWGADAATSDAPRDVSSDVNTSERGRCDYAPLMAMRGTIEQGSPSTDERGAERLLLNLEVEGSIDSGGATTVLVHNLSVSGMLVETRSDLAMGQQIKVGLPETGEVSATIVWRSETLYGCRFDRPLPRAALSAARLRNPLPSDFDPALGDIAAEEAREPLAARLRRLREERGLSLAGLASRAGLSKPSIWAWESGKTAPRIRSLQAIATALGVSDDELLMGRGPEGDSTGFADHGGGGGPGAPALQTVVETSRRRIAQAAGVDAGRVKVTIEL